MIAKPLAVFFAFTTIVCGIYWYLASGERDEALKKADNVVAEAKATKLGIMGVKITDEPLTEDEQAAFVLQALKVAQLEKDIQALKVENMKLNKKLERAEGTSRRAEEGRVEALRKLSDMLKEHSALNTEHDALKRQYIQLGKELLKYKEAEERRRNTTPAVIVR